MDETIDPNEKSCKLNQIKALCDNIMGLSTVFGKDHYVKFLDVYNLASRIGLPAKLAEARINYRQPPAEKMPPLQVKDGLISLIARPRELWGILRLRTISYSIRQHADRYDDELCFLP